MDDTTIVKAWQNRKRVFGTNTIWSRDSFVFGYLRDNISNSSLSSFLLLLFHLMKADAHCFPNG